MVGEGDLARVTPNYMPVVYLRLGAGAKAGEVEVEHGAGKLLPSDLRRNMKRPVLSARPAATFGIAVAVTILAAPLAHAQTDVQSQCASSGGQYTSEEVSPHFGSPPSLIETCCIAQKCTTYRDGVQGPTYGGG